ncbi:hypothetical protein BKA82DRAFT_4213553 [Pisolithus tinctorius]|nr:hypothetical protein BKA82DRAFT_4213553 [Pisolithus tinctorius]
MKKLLGALLSHVFSKFMLCGALGFEDNIAHDRLRILSSHSKRDTMADICLTEVCASSRRTTASVAGSRSLCDL